jgi:hypothetical protein
MSNPLHKLSFIFNVTQEQPIAIGIFTLLIVKDIKKRMFKNVSQIVVKLNMFKQNCPHLNKIVHIFWVHSILKFNNPGWMEKSRPLD